MIHVEPSCLDSLQGLSSCPCILASAPLSTHVLNRCLLTQAQWLLHVCPLMSSSLQYLGSVVDTAHAWAPPRGLDASEPTADPAVVDATPLCAADVGSAVGTLAQPDVALHQLPGVAEAQSSDTTNPHDVLWSPDHIHSLLTTSVDCVLLTPTGSKRERLAIARAALTAVISFRTANPGLVQQHPFGM